MKLSPFAVLLIVAVVAFLFLAGACLFTVQEGQQAILTQFGKVVGKPIDAPGLHFKVPFTQTVNYLENRILEWDGDANQTPTKDKLFIFVDTYARWRIKDPLTFFQRLRDEQSAHSRLDDILDGETRNAVAKHNLIELIRSLNRQPEQDITATTGTGAIGSQWLQIETGREKIEREVLQAAADRLTDLGIEVLDIRFKRLNYNVDVQKKIFERMQSERKQIAGKFQSEGMGEAARIRGERERDLRQIESDAYRIIQETRGQADAKASDIYARAYNQSAEAFDFYRFLKTMETYQAALGRDATLILSTDSEFLRFFKGPRPADAAKSPEPAKPAGGSKP